MTIHSNYQTIFHHDGDSILSDDRDIQILSRFDEPLIVSLGNVASDDECKELIALSKNRLNRSKIGTSHETNDMRTSSGMFFDESENELVAKIEKRIATIMGVPIEHAEGLQILHYKPGQEYKPHVDYFAAHSPASKNNRISTLVLYLNDVEEGGETIFPKLNLSFSPKKGTAIYFEYFYDDETLNKLTLHAGTPVITGEKWVATQWMRKQKVRK